MQLIRADPYDGASKATLASLTLTVMMVRAGKANRSVHATRQFSMCSDLA